MNRSPEYTRVALGGDVAVAERFSDVSTSHRIIIERVITERELIGVLESFARGYQSDPERVIGAWREALHGRPKVFAKAMSDLILETAWSLAQPDADDVTNQEAPRA